MAVDDGVSLYKYTPSFITAVVVAALYSVAFVITFFQWIRYRATVWVVMVVPAGMEASGYIFRAYSAKNVDNRSAFVVQFCLIVLAPVLMAAACYIVFGRIVFHAVPREALNTRLLWVPPHFVTPIFVCCDIVALFLQLVGALIITSVTVTTADPVFKLNLGKVIALIGVGVQLACFGLFAIIAMRFNFTSRRFVSEFLLRVDRGGRDKYVVIDGGRRKLKLNWQALLRVVNVVTLLILVRTVYRAVDFAMGSKGYLEEHEWPAYVFDALPIFPAVVLFIFFHPGKYLPHLGLRKPKYAR